MKAYSRWLHAIRKRVLLCNHRKKKRGVKNMKIRSCFCKYAIEDNQVVEYPIDPKAYLGR